MGWVLQGKGEVMSEKFKKEANGKSSGVVRRKVFKP